MAHKNYIDNGCRGSKDDGQQILTEFNADDYDEQYLQRSSVKARNN